MQKKSKAFSLVELSVVLIIIGILVAGAVSSSKLIDNTKVRKIITQLENFETATNSFYSIYLWLPGDLSNAATYWPSCVDVSSNTCNGNANKIVNKNYEHLRFWQHLSLAKLIDGSYTGANASGDDDETRPGENSPDSPIGDGCYYARNILSGFGEAKNAGIHLGAVKSNSVCKNSLLTAIQTERIDFKMDNGLPNSGKVLGRDGHDATAGDCVSGDAYVTTSDTISCYFAYALENN